MNHARRREFRRVVLLSAILHVAALVLSIVTPTSRAVTPPRVISVDLIGAPPPPSATQPKPAVAPAPMPPEVAPPPPVPKPRPKAVVLPEKPTQPKPKPKPKPRERREVVLDPEPKQEKDLDDLLSQLREDAGEPTPATPTETATVAPPSTTSNRGAGQPVSAETLAWVRQAKLHVRRAWVVPPGFRTQALETHVLVKLDAGGSVVGEPRITRKSGNPWYDEGVVRGIEKASPLPPPPRAGDWDFVFVPEDSY